MLLVLLSIEDGSIIVLEDNIHHQSAFFLLAEEVVMPSRDAKVECQSVPVFGTVDDSII